MTVEQMTLWSQICLGSAIFFLVAAVAMFFLLEIRKAANIVFGTRLFAASDKKKKGREKAGRVSTQELMSRQAAASAKLKTGKLVTQTEVQEQTPDSKDQYKRYGPSGRLRPKPGHGRPVQEEAAVRGTALPADDGGLTAMMRQEPETAGTTLLQEPETAGTTLLQEAETGETTLLSAAETGETILLSEAEVMGTTLPFEPVRSGTTLPGKANSEETTLLLEPESKGTTLLRAAETGETALLGAAEAGGTALTVEPESAGMVLHGEPDTGETALLKEADIEDTVLRSAYKDRGTTLQTGMGERVREREKEPALNTVPKGGGLKLVVDLTYIHTPVIL